MRKLFRFPLIGKVLGKATRLTARAIEHLCRVSISSDRESAWQGVALTKYVVAGDYVSFDSLRPGKCLARGTMERVVETTVERVSIPSDRESAWQVRIGFTTPF